MNEAQEQELKMQCLELAIKSVPMHSPEETVKRAEAYEKYVKGQASGS